MALMAVRDAIDVNGFKNRARLAVLLRPRCTRVLRVMQKVKFLYRVRSSQGYNRYIEVVDIRKYSLKMFLDRERCSTKYSSFRGRKKRRTELKRRHGALVDAWGCRISSHVSLGRTESGENRGKHELSPRSHGVVVERGLAISEKKKRKSPAGHGSGGWQCGAVRCGGVSRKGRWGNGP